jgi:uncharacterized protein
MHQNEIVVLYHGQCPDGFGAAFAAWLKFGPSADYIPCNHGDAPPDVTGKAVYILDFSYAPGIMAQLDGQARQLVMLDHHKSAADALEGFQCRCGQIHFDLGKSGARLAWEYFHPEVAVPELIALIEDRDLWNWAYPHTEHYLAVLDTLPYDFNAWLAALNMGSGARDRFVERGQVMHDKFMSICGKLAQGAMPVTVNGIEGLMVNAPNEFCSHVGSMLASRSGTFGLVWNLASADTVKVSLRSLAPAEILMMAQSFGGGGHPQAAAFRLPVSRFVELAAGNLDA